MRWLDKCMQTTNKLIEKHNRIKHNFHIFFLFIPIFHWMFAPTGGPIKYVCATDSIAIHHFVDGNTQHQHDERNFVFILFQLNSQ